MDVLTTVRFILVTAGFVLLMMGPVVLALGASSGRERRWVRRNPVVPCATLRPGARLPKRLAIYGATVPGRDGLVVAPLSGVQAVWFRTMVCSTIDGDVGLSGTYVLWERSGGDPFGVADTSGVAAVSATILQASTYQGHLSIRQRSRRPVAFAGDAPVQTVVEERTTSHRQHGPWLQQFIDRGLVRPDAARRADSVTVIEEVLPSGVPLHLIGRPTILDGGVAALTLPRSGRYLVLNGEPAETERGLAADRRSGLGCGLWAVLIGAACMAISYALTR